VVPHAVPVAASVIATRASATKRCFEMGRIGPEPPDAASISRPADKAV
jgi:hypothetical protein